MDYLRLGSPGLKVSRLCLGCMSFGSGFSWMLAEEPDTKSIAVRDLDYRWCHGPPK